MDFNWINLKNISQALKFLVNNEFLADIKFQFADGQIIYAHSLILCMRSKIFHENFKDTVGITKLIPITDKSYNIFLNFLNFLYTDEFIIIDDNVAELFELALQYSIYELEELCNESIFTKINENNACKLYELSINGRNTEELRVSCLNFISKNFLKTINSDSFIQISVDTLQAVININPVSDPNEVQICNAVVKAAQKACDHNGVRSSGDNLRKILGESIKSIRFPTMTSQEFANCVKSYPGLLSDAEIISIYTTIANKKENTLGFLNQPRRKCNPIDYYHKQELIYFKFDKITPVSGTFEFDQLELAEFEIVFTVSRAIIVKSVIFENLHGIENIVSYIRVNGDIVQRDFNMLEHEPNNTSVTAIVPFEFQPNTRYRFDYVSMDLDNNVDITKRTKNALLGKTKKVQSKESDVIFTFFIVNSHIKGFNYKY